MTPHPPSSRQQVHGGQHDRSAPDTLQPLGETLDASFFGTKVLTNLYDTSTVKGRLTNVLIGVAENDGNTYAAGYAYDTYGRLNRVTGPGLATSGSGGAWYSFDPNSDLTDKLEFKDPSGVVKGFVDWSWETHRDLVASVENRFGPSGGSTLVSKYAYGNDGPNVCGKDPVSSHECVYRQAFALPAPEITQNARRCAFVSV